MYVCVLCMLLLCYIRSPFLLSSNPPLTIISFQINVRCHVIVECQETSEDRSRKKQTNRITGKRWPKSVEMNGVEARFYLPFSETLRPMTVKCSSSVIRPEYTLASSWSVRTPFVVWLISFVFLLCCVKRSADKAW